MNDNRRIDGGKLLTGFLLIALGAVFLLDSIGYTDAHLILHRYWPMFLIAFGVARLIQRGPWAGVWLIVIGAWLQATKLHLWGVDVDTSWPLLLIAVGALMVARTLFGSGSRHQNLEARHDR